MRFLAYTQIGDEPNVIVDGARTESTVLTRAELQYRYEGWVQMVSRRPALRVDLTNLAAELNQLEQSHGRGAFDGVDQIAPRLHLEGSLNTSISPDVILLRLEEHLRVGAPAWDPYD